MQMASEAVARMEASEWATQEARLDLAISPHMPPLSLLYRSGRRKRRADISLYLPYISPTSPLTLRGLLTPCCGCGAQALWRADMAEGAVVVAQAEASP